MGPRIHTLSPNLLPQPTKFQIHPFSSKLIPTHFTKLNCNLPRTLKISCSKEKESTSDEMMAVELGVEIKKLNTSIIQREEALKISRELLFTEVCNFMGLKSADLKKRWKRMNEEERWVVTNRFVSEWSAHFHPLSARSVKEMVEEHLGQGNEFSDAASRNMFPDFRKLLGFLGNTQG